MSASKEQDDSLVDAFGRSLAPKDRRVGGENTDSRRNRGGGGDDVAATFQEIDASTPSTDRRVGGDRSDSRRNRNVNDADSRKEKDRDSFGGSVGEESGNKRRSRGYSDRDQDRDMDRDRDRDRDRNVDRNRERGRHNDGYGDRGGYNKGGNYNNNNDYAGSNYHNAEHRRDSFPNRRDEGGGRGFHRGGGGGREGGGRHSNGRFSDYGGRGRAPYRDDYATNSSFSSRKSFPPEDSSSRSQHFNHNDNDYDISYGNNPSNVPAHSPPSLPPPHPSGALPSNSWGPIDSGRLPPLMSFKAFMHTQRDDVPPDSIPRMYDQYTMTYLADFSNNFFSASKTEEWFQDRYNPLNIHRLEKEAIDWALHEAAVIRESIQSHPLATVAAMSLEPLSVLQERQNEAKADVKETDTEPPVRITGKHFSGHENRAVYVSGIHACCPKQVFKNLILEALTAHNNVNQKHLPVPERIVIAQPTWNPRNIEKFERFAWVIMPTEESARSMSALLKDLRLSVPGPIDSITGEPLPKVAISFTISATLHTTRNSLTLPDHTSHGLRVQVDAEKAQELAKLLDEEKGIHEDNRLESILALAMQKEALKYPTDKLDISIGYLRRVHFVTFYGAKRYRDEAHMLSMAPSVVHRSKPYTPIADSTPFTPAPPSAPHPSKLRQNAVKEEGEDDSESPGGDAAADEAAAPLAITDADHKQEEQSGDSGESTASRAESKSGGDDENANANPSEAPTSAEPEDSAPQDPADQVVESSSEVAPAAEEESRELVVVQEAESSVTTAAGESNFVYPDAEEGEEVEPHLHPPHSSSQSLGPNAPNQPAYAIVMVERPGGGVRSQYIPLHDRRIEMMISDLAAKAAAREALRNDPSLPALPDEEELKAVQTVHEQTFQTCMLSNCKTEKEGKARCCYAFCAKLFKDIDFLKKHLLIKHPTFALDMLLPEYEPFLRKRFEAEDLSQRPLPPVDVEMNGMIERRSVREIHNKFIAPLLPPPMQQMMPPFPPGPMGRNVSHPPPFVASPPFQHPFHPPAHHNRRHSADGLQRPQFPQPNFHNRPFMGRGGGRAPPQHGTKRSFDDVAEDDDRRKDSSSAMSMSAQLDGNPIAPVTPVQQQPHLPPMQPASAPARQYVEPKSGDNNDRKMFSYFDVDAPKESAISLDYGVAILPVKKRRIGR